MANATFSTTSDSSRIGEICLAKSAHNFFIHNEKKAGNN
jgi:hypothetical protein